MMSSNDRGVLSESTSILCVAPEGMDKQHMCNLIWWTCYMVWYQKFDSPGIWSGEHYCGFKFEKRCEILRQLQNMLMFSSFLMLVRVMYSSAQ